MQPRRSPRRRSLRAVSAEACVGIVANPASGRDIRRLVAGASVFGNADKAGMVFRLLAGLGAAGVERALMLPAGDGLSSTLHRQLDAPHAPTTRAASRSSRSSTSRLTSTADDTTRAVELMCARGVDAIAVLGGDGTHRVVARACGDVPICALSTGTNNVFPEMREATVAGIATGLVATRPRGRARARARGGARRRARRGARPTSRSSTSRSPASASSARAPSGVTRRCASCSSPSPTPARSGSRRWRASSRRWRAAAGAGCTCAWPRIRERTRRPSLQVALAPGS